MWVDYSTTPDGRDRDALSAARRAIVVRIIRDYLALK